MTLFDCYMYFYATVLLAGGWLSLVLGLENQAKAGYSPTSSRVKFIYEI